jgi:hypothetical protein
MIIKNILKIIFLGSFCFFVTGFSFGSPGSRVKNIEIVSADMWIETHNERRYLAYTIIFREQPKGFFSFLFRREYPLEYAYSLWFLRYNESVLQGFYFNYTVVGMCGGIYWPLAMGAHDYFLEQKMYSQDWGFPHPPGINYYELVDEDKRLGLPLKDGKYVVLLASGFYASDIIIMDVLGDNISLQIMTREGKIKTICTNIFQQLGWEIQPGKSAFQVSGGGRFSPSGLSNMAPGY